MITGMKKTQGRTSHEVAALHPVAMAEEDERFGWGGGRRRQPAAGEELHAPRVPHVLLMVDHVHHLLQAAANNPAVTPPRIQYIRAWRRIRRQQYAGRNECHRESACMRS